MNPGVPRPIVAARRVAGAVLILSFIIVLIAIAFLVNWYVTRPIAIASPVGAGGASVSSPTGGGSTSKSPTPTSSTKPPPKLSKAEQEQAALRQLKSTAATDLSRTSFDGQWVAQLSSKYVGVKDPQQRTKSGSHRFAAVDILQEHQGLRKKFADYDVRLLRSSDIPPGRTHQGDPFWYTFLFYDFGSKADVRDFCESAFPDRSGESLLNRCLPHQLPD